MRDLPQHQPRRHVGTVRGFSLVYERSPGLQTGEALLPKPKRLFSFLTLLILVVFSLLIFFPKLVSTTQAQTRRHLKYFGADIVSPSDFATLAQHHMNTAMVVMDVNGGFSSWEPFVTAAEMHNINLVVWPLGGSGACGFPYVGTNISAVLPLLNYLSQSDKFIGIINGHEWWWSCPQSEAELISIRQQIKDYVRDEYDRDDIKVWNYVAGINYDFVTSGEIMDVGMTWKHCFGGTDDNPADPHVAGPEGNCWDAYNLINASRAKIEARGWGHMEQTFLFHTFELPGYGATGGARMPTADEMYEWACRFLETDDIDGLLWYTWNHVAAYTQTLGDRSDLWPTIDRVWENCVNQGGVSTPTPTPTIASSPTPTPPLKDPNVNHDDQVNAADMIQLLAAWGPIVSTADEDLDSNGKVNSLDAGRIIANWTGPTPPLASPTPTSTPPPGATPTPTPGSLPTSNLIYGARYASADSYWQLAELGVMHPNSVVFNNSFQSEIDTIISTAREVRQTYPNFKPSIFLRAENVEAFPFNCNGINSYGVAFIEYLNQDGGWRWDEILAINGLHEPMGYYACDSLATIRSVITQVKSLSGGRAMILDKIYTDRTRPWGATFSGGICDYCAVLYHPYQSTFQRDAFIQGLKHDIDLVKSVAPGEGGTLNKFVPWLSVIHGYGYEMPTPAEMFDGGSLILSTLSPNNNQVDGMLWYTWDSENVWNWGGLGQYNGDGHRAGRMEVIKAVGGLRG